MEDARDDAEGLLLGKVQEAAATNWTAAAWILERRFGYTRNFDVKAMVTAEHQAAVAVIAEWEGKTPEEQETEAFELMDLMAGDTELGARRSAWRGQQRLLPPPADG